MIAPNTIVCGDSLALMRDIPDGSVDMTVTSPPYDDLREYRGFVFDFEGIARELFRVTKAGGVVVWIVGDATKDGSESGTSFKQALYFKEIGFNLHDTMIYAKGGQGSTGSNMAYWSDFEYMFVLCKGALITFNPICDRPNIAPVGQKLGAQGHRFSNGDTKQKRIINRREFGRRFNIWEYHESGTRVDHPAVFPQELAQDHILSWSNPDALILDPFLGSGTTAVAALKTGRRFIGIEISPEYCAIAQRRVDAELAQLRLNL